MEVSPETSWVPIRRFGDLDRNHTLGLCSGVQHAAVIDHPAPNDRQVRVDAR